MVAAISSAYKSENARKKAMYYYDDALSRWPVSYISRLITTRFGETYVMISGKNGAKPLVLLHGGGGNSSMWLYNIESLSQHFQVYSIDIIGEAGKSSGTRPLYESDDHAHWLKETFDALGIKKTALCGASLGGTLAHQFAFLYPQSVTALILLAPPSLGKMRFSFLFRAILANMLPATLFAKSFLKYISLRGANFSEQAIKGFVTQIQSYKPNTNKIPIMSDNELAKILTQTLILIGQDEIMYHSNDIASRVRLNAPHVTVTIIPYAKHMVSIDQPNVVNEKIINFIKTASIDKSHI